MFVLPGLLIVGQRYPRNSAQEPRPHAVDGTCRVGPTWRVGLAFTMMIDSIIHPHIYKSIPLGQESQKLIVNQEQMQKQ